MRTWILSLLVLLSGCAHVEEPSAPRGGVASLLNDGAFAAPTRPVDAGSLFDLSPAMQRHLDSAPFKALLREHGKTKGLVYALYDTNELKLDYDSSYTGTAAETYAARQGNCLSLVIMTAAFARRLDLSVRFQDVQIEDTRRSSWSARTST
jgi:hypothetical protein